MVGEALIGEMLLEEVKALCNVSMQDYNVKGTFLEKCSIDKRASLYGAIELLINATPVELGGFELTFRKMDNYVMHISVNTK